MPEAEQGLNMARNIGALAGLPYTVPAITINRYCSSGLQGIAYGAERIMLRASQSSVSWRSRINEFCSDVWKCSASECSAG